MARLANISGKQAVKTFKKLGWIVVGQVGSHVVMTKTGMKANLSVPQHKEVSIGLLRKLIKYAEIEVDEFLKECK
ncbi:type II toxin-antitoxin system HicA family toxin [Acidobacteriota bacterium]